MDNQHNGSIRSTAITVIMASVLALTIFMPLSFVLDLPAPSSQSDSAGMHSESAARG